MIKYIRALGFSILLYGVYFYLPPFLNQIKSLLTGFNFLKEFTFWNNIFLLFLYLFCGIGLMKLNRLARLCWLIYSSYMVIVNLSAIQMLIRGNFLQFKDLPLLHWIKLYSLFLIILFSIIFLNFSSIKLIFKEKKEGINDKRKAGRPSFN